MIIRPEVTDQAFFSSAIPGRRIYSTFCRIVLPPEFYDAQDSAEAQLTRYLEYDPADGRRDWLVLYGLLEEIRRYVRMYVRKSFHQ